MWNKSAVTSVKNFGGKVLRGAKNVVSKAWGGIKSFFGWADGGIVPATPGGVPSIVGEGRYNEAIVPLPDGRSIPVVMNGAGGGGGQSDPALINEVRALKAAILSMNITMDGQKVGNVIVEGSSNPGML